MEMSVPTITSKRLILHTRFMTKPATFWLAQLHTTRCSRPLGTSTPCGNNQNHGDPFAMYDQMADRWVVSDFAFASFGGSPSYECIAVSQTPDPAAGSWFLYAVPVDPTNFNDYPKAAVWNNPTPGGAYHFTFNLFASLGAV